MRKKVLITGGAGFIGSHLADELIAHGYEVRVLDNLNPQVHGENCERPEYLHPDVELIIGDVRDKAAVEKAVKGVDAVYHFAAMVGVGQSMYEIREYTDVNNVGTAVLLEVLMKNPVEKLLVASSMSIYGEGMYMDRDGQPVTLCERQIENIKAGKWELYDDNGNELIPVATPEFKVPNLSSVYALSKYDQERLCLITGKAYNIPTVALRFFNVYGTRQALSNPYTGVLAIFGSRLLNNNRPMIFEDGFQQRDFVSVKDVAAGCRLALESNTGAAEVFNIGSGKVRTVQAIAESLATVMDKKAISPEVTGKYRVGDIRHCFSDISKAREMLNYQPSMPFDTGLAELAEWLKDQVAWDRVDQASRELSARGLTV